MAETDEQTVLIKNGSASATIHFFGATLTSWKPDGKEALFVSKKSKFDNEKPIRGGVPIVFPHFGPWENGPQHGFARKMKWAMKETEDKNDSESVTLVLEESETTRAIWDYRFRLEVTFSLISDSEIMIEALIKNIDDKPFDFTFLLHNYFAVPDISECRIYGLCECMYTDKVSSGLLCDEEEEEVSLIEHTDRIYHDTPSPLLRHASENREIQIEKHNLPDTVVWNPWTEGAKSMSDFDDDEWKNMVCIEPGYVNVPYTLEPEGTYEASQILRVLRYK